ncbi:Uncharacterised protein [uncultured archaeon]|nr:Uncharacterised protein [uncultured archaeon]
MKIIFTATVLLALCLFAFAQYVVTSSGSGKVQDVGGDFGKAWISSFQAQNPTPAAQGNNDTLWNWGSMPKGKALVGGKLVDAPNGTWLYNATNWMGDSYVDPYTGSYIDPYTGQRVYSNHQVFPNYGNQQPNYSSQQGFQLPKILQSLGTGL